MQINFITLITIIISTLLVIGTPSIAYIYYHRKEQLSFKPVFVGGIVWLIITQFFEKGIHIIILLTTPIAHFPIFFSFYGAFMTGTFEEVGRLIAFKKFLPKNNHWKDGIGYGIGHGGTEAILIGGIYSLQLIIFAFIINEGKITLLKKSLPHSLFIQTVNVVYGSPLVFLIGGIERIFAFTIQIGLSILVLLAVKKSKITLLLLAILVHTLSDLPPAFYQIGKINLWATESIIILLGIGSIIWIKKSKKLFS